MLITQAVFLLERGQTDKQTDKQTDATERPTHAGSYSGVGNNTAKTSVCRNCMSSFFMYKYKYTMVQKTCHFILNYNSRILL